MSTVAGKGYRSTRYDRGRWLDTVARSCILWLSFDCQVAFRTQGATIRSQGATINKQDHSDRTPLMIAVSQGQEEAAHCLMEQGADVSVCNNQHGYNATLYACIGGHLSILRRCWVEQVIVVDGDRDDAAECDHLDIVKLLVEEQTRIVNKADTTALDVARAHDQTRVVGYLESKINSTP